VRITYDPSKRDKTLRCRGLDFADAAEIFAGPTITRPDTREDYGEDRYQTFGYLRGEMVMFAWTPRGDDRHVFSMRKMHEREQRRVREQFGEGRRDD
jgi:uncharacterized DUF497 family protein